MTTESSTLAKKTCAHCGDQCSTLSIRKAENFFCCYGCKTVYEIIYENGLEEYYSLEETPGIKLRNQSYYTFLDEPSIKEGFLQFKSDKLERVNLNLPSIHCSSCIYLLENLNRIHPGIRSTRVNFISKATLIDYDPSLISMKEVAELLERIGYQPDLSYKDSTQKEKYEKSELIKLGVAGFLFGNIMLLNFPEYFGIDQLDQGFKQFFVYIIGILSLPVFFYCSSSYFVSAYKSLRQRYANLDVPISLGILTLFTRSSYLLITEGSPGYFDSLAGLVFFLSIGRWLQAHTYKSLAFDRDYRSYFPLAVLKKTGKLIESALVESLEPKDIIQIRNQEIVPCDCTLMDDQTFIDYSFVTGESEHVRVNKGELIFSGGRQVGGVVELEVNKKVSSSFLTSLWNNATYENKSKSRSLIDLVSQYFTIIVLSIALLSALIWWSVDSSRVWEIFAAVLIVACPCALAMSTPFAYGTAMAILGRSRLYLKNAGVVERLKRINTIIFDKTGTLTESDEDEIGYEGIQLSERELCMIKEITSASIHPLSQKIRQSLEERSLRSFKPLKQVEIPGLGITAHFDNTQIKIGSAELTGAESSSDTSPKVYVAINDEVKGCFSIKNKYRAGLKELIRSLSNYEIHVLSGDNDSERQQLLEYFGNNVPIKFKQTPTDKLEYVQSLQNQEKNVMMLGDGLNDSGALRQSEVGVAISGSTSFFSPACDAIFDGNNLTQLKSYFDFAQSSYKIVIVSYVISVVYNVLGLSLAVTGNLAPVYAAILMPLSSISVILFTTLSTKFVSKNYNLP